jgi:hypothetical protein
MPVAAFLSALAPYLPYLALGGSALAGAAGGAASNRGKFQQVNRFNPQQNQQLDLLTQLGLGQLQNPQQGFEGIANKARSDFNNITVPGLAERFAGSNSRLSSPSYLSQLGAAGAQLDTNLGGQAAQYGQNQQGLALQQLGLGLQPRFDQAYMGGGDNFLSSLLGGLGRGGTQASLMSIGNQLGFFK